MTMNKKLFFLLALMLGTAGRASAQTDLSLTWDEARKMALEHNPAVKSARAAMEQADFSYFASLNSYMPQVSLSNSVTRSGGDASPASNRWGASVSASEDLLNLKTISSVRISRIAREQAEADYLSASASVRQNLGSAFIDLLFAQKRIEVQKKISGIRRENSKLIKLKYESGMESKGNSLYTSALAENADVSVKKAERQLFISQRSLLEAMGLEGTASVTAKGDISVPVFSLDEARIAQAIERSPDMVSARKSLESAKERTSSARYSAYPTLKASQSLGWNGPTEFPQTNSWSLGLSLSIPIFSGGPTYYSNTLSASKKALTAAEENFRARKISLAASLRSGYDDYLSAAETAGANTSLLKANEERYKEAQIKYMAGSISFIDLENVEQNFVDSDLNQLDYARTAHSRKLSLEQLLGTGIED